MSGNRQYSPKEKKAPGVLVGDFRQQKRRAADQQILNEKNLSKLSKLPHGCKNQTIAYLEGIIANGGGAQHAHQRDGSAVGLTDEVVEKLRNAKELDLYMRGATDAGAHNEVKKTVRNPSQRPTIPVF